MIRDIVLLQKRELETRGQEKYVERECAAKLGLADDLIKVILGPRRAGKSFFGMHALRKVRPFGYVNFDDERLAGASDYDEIVAALRGVYGDTRYLLLDEIQNLPRWELFVNRLQRQGYRLVLTGSNSHLLSSELSSHLTGRHLPLLIFPFSFREYISSFEAELTAAERSEAFNRYLQNGGFPEPLIKRLDYKEYLTTLLHSVLYKDVVKRFRIRAVQGLDNLALYLLSNIAREYSYRTLSRVCGGLSPHTMEKYLWYLEEAYLFFSVRRFSFKVKEQLAANKKVYCVDNGLVTAGGFRSSPDHGRLLENLVAIELWKRKGSSVSEVYYWKNPQQEEVDFVLKKGLNIFQLIQVCAEPESPGTRDRETRALIKASQELKCDNLLVLTDAAEKKAKVSWFGATRNIRFMPAWKWLDQPTDLLI